jgi:glycosyltransferase involved in cell wall biosynthesis
MKIAIIAPFEEFGGSEHQILYLLRGLRSHNVEVLFCHMEIRSSQLIAALKALPECRATQIDFRGIRHPLSFWRDARALAELLRRNQVDAVNCWNYSGHIIGGVASWMAGMPCIFSIRGIDPWKKAWHLPFYRLLNRLPTAFAFQSSAQRDIVCRREWIPRERTSIVPNGIDRKRFLPGDRLAAKRHLQDCLGISPDLPVVLSVGSLRRIKGHDILIEAVRLIRAQYPDLEFNVVIVGEGPLRREYERMSQGLPISFPGFHEDVVWMYQAADIYCQPSRAEGLPNAVIEAMSCGLPIVAADVGGVDDLVSKANGLLCGPEDAKSLACALHAMLTDPAVRATLADVSLRLSERFSSERMVTEYMALYQDGAK